MPIASPFQQPDPEPRPAPGTDAGPGAGGAPAPPGRTERRPSERDRTRTRTRKEPENTGRAAPTAPHGGDHGAAPDDKPDMAPGAAEEISADQADADDAGGQVVPFPGAQVDARPAGRELVPAALADAARAWWAEASATARRALDGSVYRARPPALRDSAVRLQRAEWSGGLPVLRWAGWIYGYPALAVRAVLMGVLWLLDHPTRLLVLAGVIAAALYL